MNNFRIGFINISLNSVISSDVNSAQQYFKMDEIFLWMIQYVSHNSLFVILTVHSPYADHKSGELSGDRSSLILLWEASDRASLYPGRGGLPHVPALSRQVQILLVPRYVLSSIQVHIFSSLVPGCVVCGLWWVLVGWYDFCQLQLWWGGLWGSWL